MTRNEAIQRLKLLKGSFCVDTETALDMAIEALSAEPNDDIEGDIDFHCDLKHNRMTWYNNITESPNDVVETDDEVIDHDREWIIGCIKHDGFIKTDRFDKANRIILDALEPSGDLISRADAVEAVCGGCSIETKNNCKEEGDCYEVQNLKALPSAEPKRGEWEMCEDTDGEYGVCSVCGNDADFSHYGKPYRYCPNCGAYMGVSE